MRVLLAALVVLSLVICIPAHATEIARYGKGYVIKLDENKYLLHVEGNPYEMGYQHGYLLAEGVKRMTSEFPPAVFKSFGVPEELIPAVVKLAKKLALENEKYVREEFREEMKGIADGARARGYDVTYEDVLALNMGFDAILSIVYPITTPLLPWKSDAISCDGFVAFDDATVDGRVLMGRSFMFTPDVFHEEALLIEYVPSSGNKFVSVSAPGFVGVTSAMNVKGIAIGMDMVPAMDTQPVFSGAGCLLIAREVVQYSDELSDAVEVVKEAKRGVPWLYIVGDGRGKEIGGAVLETSEDYFMVRYTDYRYPQWAKFFGFPEQIEDKDDLVALSNHYIIPQMYFKALSYPVEDSVWRYNTLVNLILENYGRIDVEKGKELVDYLHPPNYGYYGYDENVPVSGTRTLYDLTNLELWSLYGMYSDPWVHFKLQE